MRAAIEDLCMVRAVHRLQRVFTAFTARDAEELFGKFVPVSGSFIQLFFGDMGDCNTRITVLFAQLPHKRVALMPHDSAAGGPEGKSRPDKIGEGKNIEFTAEAAVIVGWQLLIF